MRSWRNAGKRREDPKSKRSKNEMGENMKERTVWIKQEEE